jgi:hypothetical protein
VDVSHRKRSAPQARKLPKKGAASAMCPALVNCWQVVTEVGLRVQSDQFDGKKLVRVSNFKFCQRFPLFFTCPKKIKKYTEAGFEPTRKNRFRIALRAVGLHTTHQNDNGLNNMSPMCMYV